MSAATEATATEIEGVVQTVFKGASPKWSAGRLLVGNRLVTYTASNLTVEGTVVTLRGEWVEHPKFGRQFKGAAVPQMPATAHGIREWMKRHATGIGPVKAGALADHYGTALPHALATEPDAVAERVRVPPALVHDLARAWAKQRDEIAVFSVLTDMGLAPGQAEKVYAAYKGTAADVVRADPYRLMREVDGFGWKTVDEIAARLGVPKDSPARYQAAVLQAVIGAYGEGSTAVAEADAVAAACDLCDLPLADFLSAFEPLVSGLVAAGHLCRTPAAGGGTLSLPACYGWERVLWAILGRARDRNPHVDPDFADALAAAYSKVNGKELDETQLGAVRAVARHRIAFVTGGAGVGKTLVAAAVYKMFADMGVPVSLCAPTGKAARRLEEVIGARAQTIHRLLGYNPALPGASRAGFEYHMGFQLPSGAVIVDEVSMVSSDLAFHLLSACGSNQAVVLIGDPNQLPPVGAGALLRDVIEHDLAPVATLGRCHRQAGTLKRNCNALLAGEFAPSAHDEPGAPWVTHVGLDAPDAVLRAISKLWREHFRKWGLNPATDVQFLTARHDGPLGTKFLNRFVQRLRQAELGIDLPEVTAPDDARPVLMPGDKVIQTVNDYALGVMNGTQGVVEEVEPRLRVEYPDGVVEYPRDRRGAVQLAYAITPHKAQGSEYPCAAVVVPKAHSFMQHRHWLYTACTRARKVCVVFGDGEGVRRAVNRVELDRRETLLAAFARHPEARPDVPWA